MDRNWKVVDKLDGVLEKNELISMLKILGPINCCYEDVKCKYFAWHSPKRNFVIEVVQGNILVNFHSIVFGSSMIML